MPEDTGPLPGGPTVADRWLATMMYLKTPHALVQASELAMFSASTVGVALGAPQRYYLAGTPPPTHII